MLIGFPKKKKSPSSLLVDSSPIFFEEIYARSCESLVDSMAETRNELSNYREFMEISDRIKRPEVKKTQKIGWQMHQYPGNKGPQASLRLGRLS